MKGRCVICGTIGNLTRDHVPPRGVVPAQPLDIRRLSELIHGPGAEARKSRRAFQAPSFPTLCRACNVERLGAQYDPKLVDFARSFTMWVRAATKLGLVLPEIATVDLEPCDVARAVIGHLLAAVERPDPSAPITTGPTLDAMRSYFLGTGDDPPPFRLFVWPYTARDLVIVRGFGLARILRRTHAPIVGDVLKFFPVAFWLVWWTPEEVEFPFAEIPLTAAIPTALRIPLRQVPPGTWPERPLDGEIVASSQNEYIATPQPRRPPA